MRFTALALLAACSGSPGKDVVGPFGGEVHRYAIDSVRVARDATEATAVAADLDGDGEPENQLGNVTAVLASTNDLSVHASDMIAAGGLASYLELEADDLVDDAKVGVRYYGADGDQVVVAGGTLAGGVFRSNRTFETHAPGRAVTRLPIYTNSDPLALVLEGMELDLDPDGRGGFDGVVRGAVREEIARDAAYTGLVQMFATEPQRHLVFARQIDTDGDGALSREEVDNSVIALLVAADVHMFDGERYAPRSGAARDSLSFAFAIHATPCDAGTCVATPPVELCRDRVRDGDESDIDCGGGCQPCATDLGCNAPADCQSTACDAGHCRAPSCSDGVRDGFESDRDCGGICGDCDAGETCATDTDCASGDCMGGVGSTGTCAP